MIAISIYLEGERLQNKWSCQVHKTIRGSKNISRLNDALNSPYAGKIYSPFPESINIASMQVHSMNNLRDN